MFSGGWSASRWGQDLVRFRAGCLSANAAGVGFRVLGVRRRGVVPRYTRLGVYKQ